MFKKVFLTIFFFIIITPSYPHVLHYKNLQRLEFDLYRNNKFIGTHIFLFTKRDENLIVDSKINFKIQKFGVTLYKYEAEGTEVYNNGNLISFNSKTNQNKKTKYVNIEVNSDTFIIDGSSYKGEAPLNYIIGTWWNHEIVNAKAQISAVSGRIIEQKVVFLGKETIEINGNNLKTLHFNFSSTDKKLARNKKLNTDVWYDEENLNWVKARFKKTGIWEYRLRLSK